MSLLAFSVFLANFLKEERLSVKDLADLLKISASHVSRWLEGEPVNDFHRGILRRVNLFAYDFRQAVLEEVQQQLRQELGDSLHANVDVCRRTSDLGGFIRKLDAVIRPVDFFRLTGLSNELLSTYRLGNRFPDSERLHALFSGAHRVFVAHDNDAMEALLQEPATKPITGRGSNSTTRPKIPLAEEDRALLEKLRQARASHPKEYSVAAMARKLERPRRTISDWLANKREPKNVGDIRRIFPELFDKAEPDVPAKPKKAEAAPVARPPVDRPSTITQEEAVVEALLSAIRTQGRAMTIVLRSYGITLNIFQRHEIALSLDRLRRDLEITDKDVEEILHGRPLKPSELPGIAITTGRTRKDRK